MISLAMLWQKRAPPVAVSSAAGTIRTATVSRGPVVNTLRLTGVTAAENFASLITPQLRGSRADNQEGAPAKTAQMGSRRSLPAAASDPSDRNDFSLVLRHAVKPGTQVEKGQVVAEFDRQYMLNRVEDYRAVVVQTEAGLKKQKAGLELSRKAHEQVVQAVKAAFDKARLELQKMPVLSAMDAERTKLAFEEAEARSQQLVKEDKFRKSSQDAELRSSELAFEQAKLELRRAEADSNLMVAKAPLAGTAVMQSVFRNGELAPIQEGDQLWSGVFYLQVVDPGSMVVNGLVNQVDVEKLRLGQRATVRLDAYPGLELPAHVISIAAGTKPAGTRASFVKEVPVRLKIDQKDPRVIPDLSISADVAVASDDRPAAVAPAGAVFRDNPLAQPYVYVQGESGWERRDVELGLTNHLQATIRSGLKPGEVVALDRPKVPEAP
jgi:HlyD family secretion protein